MEKARDKPEDFKSSILNMKGQLLGEWPGQGMSRAGGCALLGWAATLLFLPWKMLPHLLQIFR